MLYIDTTPWPATPFSFCPRRRCWQPWRC